MMSDKPTIFIVDDDESFRKVVGRLLESVGLHVHTYQSAGAFLEACNPDQPGCLLLDIRLQGMSGLQLQEHLASRQITLPVIFITGYGDIEMAVGCMRAGAVDFIEKPFREQVLLDRVRQALQQDARQRMQRAKHEELQRQVAHLTTREHEVLDLIVAGKPNKQIASELNVSVKAVEAHRSRVLKKMGARSSIELVHMVLAK